jgi:aminopeptidase S
MSHNLRTTLAIMAVVLLLCAPIIFADAPQAQSTTSYVALVFQLRPSVTPTLAQPHIVNGGFEQGSLGWQTSGYTDIADAGAGARTGRWTAWLGHTLASTSTLSQDVTITAATPYLEFWFNVQSYEQGCTDDRAVVLVDSQVVTTIEEFCKALEHRVYRRRPVDLRSFIGKTVHLEFVLTVDLGAASYWQIDDVALKAKP